ncbi:GNAT family acetyltransferase [Apiospora arundinis]|uniref:GNAT family acetyltransferase n=1 Tax=Apiospora arundinis TaxID=335852 RepID=A0ABR2ITJ8_9PEZI
MPFTPSSTFYLSAPRVYISHFHAPQHNQFIVDLYNNELYAKYNGKTSIDTPAKAQAHIEDWMPGWHERNGYGPYVVSLRFARDIIVDGNDDGNNNAIAAETDGEKVLSPGQVPIGIATLMRGSHFTVPDCGFALLPAYAGKGYATEAGRRIIKYAMDPKPVPNKPSSPAGDVPGEDEGLGLEGVFGFTGKDNTNSKKVCERIGLEFRGVYPLEAFGNQPSAVYALPGMETDLSVYGIKVDKVDVVE